jgi:glycosyltransferase involved in cell wall biosynthesis
MLLYNQRLFRTGSWHEKLVASVEGLKFLSHESRLSARAAVNVFCSSVDLECVRSRAPESHFAIIPNGVDCEKFHFKDTSEEDPATIIFTGSFTHSPNRHAMKLFIRRIFPIVKRRVPRSRLVIVGNQARQRMRALSGDPSIEIVDFVPNLRPALATATVAVAPLTFGVGVTNKVLEAFGTGTAVVATPVACGDLPVREGVHLLLASNATAFAEEVIRLLLDANLRRRLAINARQFVECTYDWEIVSKQMEELMQQLLQSPAQADCLTPSTA